MEGFGERAKSEVTPAAGVTVFVSVLNAKYLAVSSVGRPTGSLMLYVPASSVNDLRTPLATSTFLTGLPVLASVTVPVTVTSGSGPAMCRFVVAAPRGATVTAISERTATAREQRETRIMQFSSGCVARFGPPAHGSRSNTDLGIEASVPATTAILPRRCMTHATPPHTRCK